MLQIKTVKVNGQVNPLGIDEKPMISWVLESDQKDTFQKTYRIKVNGPNGVWDTGRVESGESCHVPLPGDFRPQSWYGIKVAATDNFGQEAEYVSFFETGLMGQFPAEWITDGRTGSQDGCPIFQKSFSAKKQIASARLYASALGVYEAKINGRRVGSVHMAPGWTNYAKRIEYQTYDISDMIQEENRIEITVGRGWYRGVVGYFHAKNFYGDKAAVIALLQINYEDGTIQTVATDRTWEWTTGPIRDSELYDGETVDFTFQPPQPQAVQVYPYAKNILVAQECPPARMMEEIPARELIHTPVGETVIDFGQNLTGFVRARLRAPRGTMVTIEHAEVLDEKGNFYTINLRAAKAKDTIICDGTERIFQPCFTFHGFRYIRISGLGENPELSDFTAVVCHSDLEQTGRFACSHQGLNQLQHNILWGQKGNFLDIPTDCPQRDERLGWTGDAQVFFNTAAFNMDVSQFFKKWMRDVRSEQSMELGVPTSIPDVIHEKGTAGWGDCATIIPWNLYQIYGDTELLREQYPTMRHWLDYIQNNENEAGLWQSGFQHGDWLALDGGDNENACIGATDVYLIANAFYENSIDLTRRAAVVLGYTEDATELSARYEKLLQAFRAEFITETGRLVSDTQTAAVLVLHFRLAEERHQERILGRLVENIRRHRDHLVTGFLGTPYLCHVLSENGYHELAGKIVLQEDFPSWLYAVNMGATTVWERWNSMNPDRTISDTGMTSFNHYAYGCVGEWLYGRLCGLRALEPGYKRSVIEPKPIDGLTWAEASVETAYGTLSSRWEREDSRYKIYVKIPVNTTAQVILPGSGKIYELGSGRYTFQYEVA